MALDVLQGRPVIENTPSGLKRITRFKKLNAEGAKAANLSTYFEAYGTADVEFTTALLVEQRIDRRSEQGIDVSLVKVYQELADNALTATTEVTESTAFDGRRVTRTTYLCRAEDAASLRPAIGSGTPAVFQVDVEINGPVAKVITSAIAITSAGFVLSTTDDTRDNGALLIRNIRTVGGAPSTPSGYTVASTSTQQVDGYTVYNYSFAKGEGQISREDGTSNNGALLTASIRHITVPGTLGAPGTNPITTPSGYTLVSESYQEADGHRVWTASYAKGEGEVSRSSSLSEGGKLQRIAITHLTASSVTVQPTTDPLSGGTAIVTGKRDGDGHRIWEVTWVKGYGRISTSSDPKYNGQLTLTTIRFLGSDDATTPTGYLVTNDTQEQDGYQIITRTYASGSGEISRAFSNSQGGAVDFNPASPTANAGAIVCTIRHLTAPSVTTDPTTRPASFTRLDVDVAEGDGYRIWTVRYGYGSGTVLTDVNYKNAGALTVTAKTSLGSPPTAPSPAVSGNVSGITVTNAGSGYTSAPTIAITGGSGTGATAVAVLNGTTLASIAVTSAGSGYTSAPTVSISGGGGSGATATAALTGAAVASVALTNVGTGYTSSPTVTVSGGGGSGATVTAAIAAPVASTTVTAPGSGYTSAPTVAFSGGGGTGAAATAILTGTTIANATLTAPGSGFTSTPTVTLTGGGGLSAVITPVLSATTVASVALTSAGSGVLGSAPSAAFSGGAGSGAAATVNTSGGIGALTLVAGGTGYSDFFIPTLSGGGGSGAVVYGWASGGVILGFSVEVVGSGYTSAPTIDLSPGGGTGGSATVSLYGGISRFYIGSRSGPSTTAPTVSFSGGGGTGAAGGCVIYGGIPYLYISNPGTGYTSAPTASFSGGSFTILSYTLTRPNSTITGFTLTNAGSGYTSAPTLAITASGLSGATGTVTLAATTIASLTVSTPGSGYTSAPTISITGGGGTGATGTCAITATTIASLSLTSFGSGYSTAPTIAFTGGGGTGGAATAALGPSVVTGLTLTAPGSGYTSAPTLSISGGGGSGAAGAATITGTSVASISVTAAGTGYTSAPTISLSGGGGTAATATATLTATTVASVTVTAGGSGYVSAPSVGFSGGGGSSAAATAAIVTTASAVTLVSARERKADGYTIYDYVWQDTNGTASVRLVSQEDGALVYTVTTQTGTASTPDYPGTGTAYLIALDQSPADGYFVNVATYKKPPADYNFPKTISFTMPGLATAGNPPVLEPPITKKLKATFYVSYSTTKNTDTPYTVNKYAQLIESYLPLGSFLYHGNLRSLDGYLGKSVDGATANVSYRGISVSAWSNVVVSSDPVARPTGLTVIDTDCELYLTDTSGVQVWRNVSVKYTF